MYALWNMRKREHEKYEKKKNEWEKRKKSMFSK